MMNPCCIVFIICGKYTNKRANIKGLRKEKPAFIFRGTILFSVPTRNERRLRRQRGMIALLATKGRFISPRGVCFSTITFSFPEECCLLLNYILGVAINMQVKELFLNRLSGCPCRRQRVDYELIDKDSPCCPMLSYVVLCSNHLVLRFEYICSQVQFLFFALSFLFAVRERPRCSSRTTALPFANNRAALRERQITFVFAGCGFACPFLYI